MASNQWSVTVGGSPATLFMDENSVRVLAGEEATSWYRGSLEVAYPTSFAASLVGDEGQVVVGFRSTADQRQFRVALAPEMFTVPTVDIQLSSLLAPIGSEVVASLGLVRAHAVMSRNVLSDAGSDLMSLFGGSLGGIEAAIEGALRTAEQRLRQNAGRLGADHVLNVVIALETVSEKAQAILMSGTAVRTRPARDALPMDEAAVDPRTH
nr:heavy metal-binding domain-containing protein [uncultured Nocardioides sp.]